MVSTGAWVQTVRPQCVSFGLGGGMSTPLVFLLVSNILHKVTNIDDILMFEDRRVKDGVIRL